MFCINDNVQKKRKKHEILRKKKIYEISWIRTNKVVFCINGKRDKKEKRGLVRK